MVLAFWSSGSVLDLRRRRAVRRRGGAEAEELQVRRDHLEQHVGADLHRAALVLGGAQQRRVFGLHHHFADEGRGRDAVDVEGHRVALLHAQRRGVDHHVEAGRVLGAGLHHELRIVLAQAAGQRLDRGGRSCRTGTARPRRPPASDAAMAEPTPPVPDTSTRVPLSARPLRSTPRTKPAPSNWSPSSVPSGRFRIALQAPAMRAVGVTSSTRLIVVTLCGIVTSAPRRLVRRPAASAPPGSRSGLTPIGITTASMPLRVEPRVVDHRRLERLRRVAEVGDEGGLAADHGGVVWLAVVAGAATVRARLAPGQSIAARHCSISEQG